MGAPPRPDVCNSNVSNAQPTTCLNTLLDQARRRQLQQGGQQQQGGAQDGTPSSSGSASAPTSDQQQDASAASPQQLPALTRELVLAKVVARLGACFAQFEAEGFAPLEPAYLAAWLHSGQAVTFLADSEEGGSTYGPGSTPGVGGTAGTAVGGADGLASALSSSLAVGGGTGRTVELTIRGLTPTGFLRGEDAQGRVYELTPDGNSLDMMQGLVRRKLQ